MKTKELRVGNWVKTCVPHMNVMIPTLITQVQGIVLGGRVQFCHEYNFDGFEMFPQYITGVPLTPEILEKAGFTLFPWGWVKKASNGFGIRLNVQSFSYDVSGNSPVKIEHLHQLQNLYFALTGEELEINL